MTAHLLDTNLPLRLADPASPDHAAALNAITRLLTAGHELYITTQNIIEFWSVASRPTSVNGFGWNTRRTLDEVEFVLSRFPLLDDIPAVMAHWLQLVSSLGVVGRQVHDARIVAVMKAHAVTHLVTFNVRDFRRYPDVTIIDPNEMS